MLIYCVKVMEAIEDRKNLKIDNEYVRDKSAPTERRGLERGQHSCGKRAGEGAAHCVLIHCVLIYCVLIHCVLTYCVLTYCVLCMQAQRRKGSLIVMSSTLQSRIQRKLRVAGARSSRCASCERAVLLGLCCWGCAAGAVLLELCY